MKRTRTAVKRKSVFFKKRASAGWCLSEPLIKGIVNDVLIVHVLPVLDYDGYTLCRLRRVNRTWYTACINSMRYLKISEHTAPCHTINLKHIVHLDLQAARKMTFLTAFLRGFPCLEALALPSNAPHLEFLFRGVPERIQFTDLIFAFPDDDSLLSATVLAVLPQLKRLHLDLVEEDAPTAAQQLFYHLSTELETLRLRHGVLPFAPTYPWNASLREISVRAATIPAKSFDACLIQMPHLEILRFLGGTDVHFTGEAFRTMGHQLKVLQLGFSKRTGDKFNRGCFVHLTRLRTLYVSVARWKPLSDYSVYEWIRAKHLQEIRICMDSHELYQWRQFGMADDGWIIWPIPELRTLEERLSDQCDALGIPLRKSVHISVVEEAYS